MPRGQHCVELLVVDLLEGGQISSEGCPEVLWRRPDHLGVVLQDGHSALDGVAAGAQEFEQEVVLGPKQGSCLSLNPIPYNFWSLFNLTLPFLTSDDINGWTLITLF